MNQVLRSNFSTGGNGQTGWEGRKKMRYGVQEEYFKVCMWRQG